MIDLSYSAVCRSLGLHDQIAGFQSQWDRAAEEFHVDGDWLPTPQVAADYCNWIGMDEKISSSVVEGARLLRTQPPLVMLAWQYYWAMSIRPLPPIPWVHLPAVLGLAGRMFQVVVVLSGIPRYRHEHSQRGIPGEVTRDNLAVIELWMRNYFARFGEWGLERGSWIKEHLSGRLVRLGRLEFGISKYEFSFTILKQRGGGRQVLALADSGMHFREDGRFYNAQGTNPSEGGWKAQLQIGDQFITGHPVVDPNVVSRLPLSLEKSEWEIVLEAGDPVLDVHIPAQGKLGPASCDEAFARALMFFPKYYPEHAFKAFTCGSWLVDPQFTQLMPGSNMAAFAHRFHHMPHGVANDDQAYELGLGGRRPLNELPRDTSLRRTLVEHLEKGGHWWYTNGVVLREEVSVDPSQIHRLQGF